MASNAGSDRTGTEANRAVEHAAACTQTAYLSGVHYAQIVRPKGQDDCADNLDTGVSRLSAQSVFGCLATLVEGWAAD